MQDLESPGDFEPTPNIAYTHRLHAHGVSFCFPFGELLMSCAQGTTHAFHRKRYWMHSLYIVSTPADIYTLVE